MASLRKLPSSRYFIACFTDQDGVQRQRSTKQTKRSLAQKVAEGYESAYRNAQTANQARRVVSDILKQVSGSNLPCSRARDYFDVWLKRKRVETKSGTVTRYVQILDRFEAHLGVRADNDLSTISKHDVQTFRDQIVQKLSPTSANIYLKVLRTMFNDAWRDDIITDNPAAKIKTLKVAEHQSHRRPFTEKEIVRLLAVADAEWEGLILMGLYTAQRLGDIATLTWAAVDFTEKEITFSVSKTGRRLSVPMHPALESYLSKRPAPIDLTTPIFPRASSIVRSQERTGALSNQFYKLLVKAGLASSRPQNGLPAGPGRAGKRKTNDLSFHSLRHTATSMMKNNGVSESVAMDIVGHETRAVSNNYTHIEDSSRRSAIEKLPNLELRAALTRRINRKAPSLPLKISRTVAPTAAA